MLQIIKEKATRIVACGFDVYTIIYSGEMSEWPKEHDWKSCISLTGYRGFESLSLHHIIGLDFCGFF